MTGGSYNVSGQSNPGYMDTELDGNQGSVVFNNNARSPADSTVDDNDESGRPPEVELRKPKSGDIPPVSTEISLKTYGLFKYAPECCRNAFLTATGLLVFLCWASTMQGILVNGCVNVVISTLERRFDLKSVTSGLIAGSYDIGSLLAVIPISYLGGLVGSSKPRYLAFGLVCLGSGALLFSLPHFITDNYLTEKQFASITSNGNSSGSADQDICEKGDSLKHAEDMIATLSHFKYFFFFGQFLNGIGAAPIITLGTTLIDESVDRISAPLYIGIFQTFFVVGPAIGYIAGGSLLELFVDFDTLTTSQLEQLQAAITSSDALWVGAWWLGFLICWVLSWFGALFFFCYPAVLPNNPLNKLTPGNQQTDASYGSTGDNNHSFGEGNKQRLSKVKSVMALPTSILTLLKNPTYIFISLGGAFDGMAISGLSTFLPKFIQYQYGYTAGFSAIIIGALVTPAGGLGTFSGGYVAKRFQLKRAQVLKMYMICQAITIPCALGLLLYCASPNTPGVNTPYNSTLDAEKTLPPPTAAVEFSFPKLSLASSCNACNGNCGNLTDFTPVCGSDNRMYFNPCYAGCLNSRKVNGTDGEPKKEYFDCSCVEEDKKTATLDSCDFGCSSFGGFAVLSFFIIWFTFMAAMPSVVATLRYVEPESRSLALGVQSIILRLLGSIPGPVLYGKLIDETCLLGSGKCLVYDNYKMSVYLTIITCTSKLLAVLSFALALYTSRWCKVPEETGELDVEVPNRRHTIQDTVNTRKLTR